MTVAWIAFAGSVVAAVLAAYTSARQSRANERLEHLRQELELEAHRREATIDRAFLAADVLTRYRQPLAAAAFDLQSRLFNLVKLDFVNKWGGSHQMADEAYSTTLFRLCQYFGWSEILRRDIQFLSFPEDKDTRQVADLQARIEQCFLTDSYGVELMIWRDQQRALGERMIVAEDGTTHCMGYARFCETQDDMLRGWRERLKRELPDESALMRLRDAQHHLCELVRALDPTEIRYPADVLNPA